MIGRIWRACLAAAGVRTWAIILGAPAVSAYVVWVTWLVRYGWPETTAEQRLTILFWGLMSSLAIIAIIVVALAQITLKANASKDGVSLNVGEDDHPPEQVKVTTETTVSAEKV